MELMLDVSDTTGISWWDENRRRLNEAIRTYNVYIEGLLKGIAVTPYYPLAKVEQIRKYGKANEFSGWQFDVLDEIERRLKE
jgi:hypothetical protein